MQTHALARGNDLQLLFEKLRRDNLEDGQGGVMLFLIDRKTRCIICEINHQFEVGRVFGPAGSATLPNHLRLQVYVGEDLRLIQVS